MKTKKIIYAILLATGIALPFLSFTNYGFPDHTGAPKQLTCAEAGCHASAELNAGPGKVEMWTNIPNTGWVPGQTYEITVKTSQEGRTAYGFQLMAWGHVDSASVGTLSAPNGSKAQVVGSWAGPNKYATHKGATISGSGWNSWTFNWTAPDANDTNEIVTFYATGVAANANGQSTGDYAYSTAQTYNSSNYTNVKENQATEFRVFPNPSTGEIFLDLSTIKADIKSISITDYTGKVIQNKIVNKAMSVASVQINEGSGLYFITVNTSENAISAKVMIH
jgi:hypothetical protein